MNSISLHRIEKINIERDDTFEAFGTVTVTVTDSTGVSTVVNIFFDKAEGIAVNISDTVKMHLNKRK